MRVARSMIGRQPQLRSVSAAVTGPGGLVLIGGAAGIGKTRLLAELLGSTALAGRRVLTGHCHPVGEPFLFGPVIEALGTMRAPLDPTRLSPVAGALHPLLPELSGILPPALPPSGDPATDRHRVMRAVAEVLGALAPVVLVLEDLHWVDAHSYDLLRYLTRTPVAGVTLVCTYRPDEGPAELSVAALPAGMADRTRCTHLALEPLDPAEVAALAADLLGAPVPAEFARDLHDCTSGIPFAVEEVLSLFEGLETPGRLDPRVVPAGIRDPIRARLALAGPDAAAVTHAAAVLGTPAPADLLLAVAGGSDPAAVTGAVSAGLLWSLPGGGYGFRHALAQHAVYNHLGDLRLRALHARAAAVLATVADPPHARLAEHHRRCGQYLESVRHAELAADSATARGDDAAGAALLRAALDTLDLPADNFARLARKLGKAAMYGLPPEESMRLLPRVLADPLLPDEARGEIRLDLALVLRSAGQDLASYAAFVRAVDELADQPALAARAMAALAMPMGRRDVALSEHLGWLDRAVALLPRVPDPAVRLAVRMNQAYTLDSLHSPDAERLIAALPTGADTPQERLQVARGWGNLAITAVDSGRYRRAADILAFVGDPASFPERLGRITYRTAALRLDWATGHWTDLETRIGELREDGPSRVAPGLATIGGLHDLATADLASAEIRLRQVLATDPADTTLEYRTEAAPGLIRLLVSRGDLDEAVSTARREVAAVGAVGCWPWGADLLPTAVAALARHDPAEARDWSAAFTAGVDGLHAPLAAAAVLDCAARLAEATGAQAEAADGYRRAAAAYAELPRPYDAAQATEAAGRCLLAAGRDGAGPLGEAIATYDRLGAAWDAARARAALRAHGLRVSPRRGRRGYGTELSPRERDVVRLAGLGHSNREIAATLFLSERTVEEHVAKAMRKLGVRSRREFGTGATT
ncbi:LuxR family transcriptional regulator [Longispora fulva]|uniref:DNA-binding CsgD family transcriptional regulator n=1 Tax=Longispora fulva TaxID=619741 RepID=A0A8J7KUQ3_9ACTN|nr:LuxR family transcriptional regulator [Longispora fulva]MBG6134297.1 DNA-binding CsgD family transcriptional regulator [Longispora fulva]GIG63011.1 LuxR family transcriptional regulator [Longispora fulva]